MFHSKIILRHASSSTIHIIRNVKNNNKLKFKFKYNNWKQIKNRMPIITKYNTMNFLHYRVFSSSSMNDDSSNALKKKIVQNNNIYQYDANSKTFQKSNETKTFSSVGQRFVKHLLPKDYKTSVPRSYIDYSKVYAVGALASSAAMVLSTQSLLYAIGLGAGAIPLSAAINWVLKDGLGQLGGVLFTSFVNNKFDSDPKRWRIVAAFSLDIAMYLEALTPLAPVLFLPLAAVANTCKSISWLAASATRAGIHLSFANKGNLADITGKAGSQGVVASTAGNFLGIFMSPFVGTDPYNIFACVFALSTVHLGSMFLALNHVSLNTLNMQRGEMFTRYYLDHYDGSNNNNNKDVILTPEMVAKEEVVVGSNLKYLFNGFDSKLIVGPPIDNFSGTMMLSNNDTNGVDTLLNDLELNKFVVFDYSSSSTDDGIGLYFDENATTRDMLKGYLTSMHYIRSMEDKNNITYTSFETSKEYGEKEVDHYILQLESNGWNVQHVFFDEKNMGKLKLSQRSDGED